MGIASPPVSMIFAMMTGSSSCSCFGSFAKQNKTYSNALSNECTKVQNLQHHHVSGYSWHLIMCTSAFRRKMANCTHGFQQRECWISATERFQRKPYKFLTSLACRVRDSIFRTHTHTDDYSNLRCACALRVNHTYTHVLLYTTCSTEYHVPGPHSNM